MHICKLIHTEHILQIWILEIKILYDYRYKTKNTPFIYTFLTQVCIVLCALAHASLLNRSKSDSAFWAFKRHIGLLNLSLTSEMHISFCLIDLAQMFFPPVCDLANRCLLTLTQISAITLLPWRYCTICDTSHSNSPQVLLILSPSDM